MAPSKKRKAVSSSSGNTLLSYFSSGVSAALPAFKKVKHEEGPKGNEAPKSMLINGTMCSGSKEAPIIVVPDDDEDEPMIDADDIATVKDEPDVPNRPVELCGCGPSQGTRASPPLPPDVVPLRDCTPPPNSAADPSSLAIPRCPSPAPSFEDAYPSLPGMPEGNDEWGMGDDEAMPGGDDDDIEGFDEDELEVEQEVECVAGGSADGMGCPICGVIIGDPNELQRHANACLDSPRPSTLKPPPPPPLSAKRSRSPSPLKPLSTSPPSFSFPTSTTTAAATSANPSAFSVLMSQNKESIAWASAEADERRRGVGARGRRKAPFYKVMQGMPVAVDAFCYGKIPDVSAYLLTHAHSDHYTNLSSSWKNGPIYCSETTANLIKLNLKVADQYVRPLPLNTPTVLPDTGGVTVTLLEANHCPGSVLFLFTGRQTINAGDSPIPSPFVGTKRVFRYLHCGDFRACPKHALADGIRGKKLDLVYLDTTYLNPKYCFPPQPQVIDACAALSRRVIFGSGCVKKEEVDESVFGRAVVQPMIQGWLKPKEEEDVKLVKLEEGEAAELELMMKAKEKSDRILVAIGTYSIGKERIVKAIARALSSKVYCDARKRAILQCQSDPELHDMLSDDPFTARVHLLPLQNISVERMTEYLSKFKGTFDRVLGFRPTGWTYTPPAGTDTMPDVTRVIVRDQKRMFDETALRPMRGASAQYMLYGVPYSEHSSFFELTCFALSVDVAKIIATVNVGSASSRGKMAKWFEKWEFERKKRRNAGAEDVVRYRTLDYW